MQDNAVLDVIFSSESTTYPVTTAQAKAWAKIDLSDDDAIVTELIKTATRQCEGYLGVSILQRTVTAYLNNCVGGIEFPYGPVVTFTALYDENGDEIPSDEYTIRGGLYKWLESPVNSYLKAVYTAGLSSVPDVYVTAIKQQVAYLYDNRGDGDLQSQLSDQVKQTLHPYKRVV